MKTAISIPDDIIREVDHLAKINKWSRSEIFTTAIREYIELNKRNLLQKSLQDSSNKLLDCIDKAFSENNINEDVDITQLGKKYFAKTVLKEKY
jgi:hypothetical protein